MGPLVLLEELHHDLLSPCSHSHRNIIFHQGKDFQSTPKIQTIPLCAAPALPRAQLREHFL